ncbi:hypothetical protein [Nocardia asiatica]|uniref:hypothetical protein n=1 Tax=Nocardia asiatica TaxID=209252 RepID=UPI0024559662|nr:hypothetical protein [Nocardia asiatica]
MGGNEALKAKLWAAIDELDDDDGFVLVAASDEIQFTRLKAVRGWDDSVLELDPLVEAETRKEVQRLGRLRDELFKTCTRLDQEITTKQARLDDINAALTRALGRTE